MGGKKKKLKKKKKKKNVFNIFFVCFAIDTFMESINSSGLSVTRNDQGVPRGQIDVDFELDMEVETTLNQRYFSTLIKC
jgi:hypothetical protein